MAETEIVTEGSGLVEQPGEQAELMVEFAATAAGRAEAVTALTVRLRALDTDLIAAQTVRDRRFWVNDEWRGDRVVGCRAVQTMQIAVTDLAALEDVVAALIAAEPSSFSGPLWSLTDQAAARREAQRLAVADARARAEGYAGALGGALGALVRLAEAPGGHSGPYFGHAAAPAGASMGPPSVPDVRELRLDPQPVQVYVQCSTTWLLES